MNASSVQPAAQQALFLVGSRKLNKRMCLFAEGLVAAGAAVRVLAPPRHRWSWNRGEAGLLKLDAGRLFLSTADASTRHRPDLVVCFHWAMLPLAIVLRLLCRCQIVYDEYDFYELNTLEGEGSRLRRIVYRLLIRALHRLCLPWVDQITCIHMAGGFLKRRLQRYNPNVLELHNYPTRHWTTEVRDVRRSLHADRPEQRAQSQPICFVFVGGIWEVKGCRVVSEAFDRLTRHRSNHNAELHYFGSGDERLIDWLHVCPGIHVHGETSPADIREFLTTHRCAGLMLYHNGPRYRLIGTNSRKMFEYAATGAALIATSIGEVTSFVSRNDVGYLVSAKPEVNELTRVFERVLDHPADFERKCRNATSLMAQQHMTWESQWYRFAQAIGLRLAPAAIAVNDSANPHPLQTAVKGVPSVQRKAA